MFGIAVELLKEKREPKPDHSIFDGLDLTDKVFIVTGASGGIGAHVARVLAKQHAKVYLAARSVAKVNKVVESIIDEYPHAKLATLIMDFCDLSTIKPAVQTFLSKEERLHGIVHNAGVMIGTGVRLTKQGHEEQIGVNCLAPHLLQRLLDETILATPDSRVVWLSSAGHFNSPSSIPYHDMGWKNSYTLMLSRYSNSKLINLVQATQWSDTISSSVPCVAVHPGVIASDLYRGYSGVSTAMLGLVEDTVPNGAYPVLYALLILDKKECTGENGGCYLVPFDRVASRSRFAETLCHSEEGQRVWDWCDEQIKTFV